VDGARHHVPRRQLGVGVIAGHEGFAVPIDQLGAFAAQGFGGQRGRIAADVDGGRVELHELGIGDGRAGQGRKGQALALEVGRRGGDAIEAADAAGRQDGGGSDELDQLAVLFGQHAADASLGVAQQAAQPAAGAHLYVARRQGGGDHRVHDRAAGLVALHPRHARARVRRFEAGGELAIGAAVKRRAERGQVADGLGPFLRQDRGHGLIHQARARSDGVGGVQFGSVLAAQRRSHAALRPSRGTTLAEGGAGQDQSLSRRGGQGCGQPGQAGADDQHAVVLDPFHGQISSTSTWWRAFTRS
jgi:hypothetical protein